jgi:hypothetical protein
MKIIVRLALLFCIAIGVYGKDDEFSYYDEFCRALRISDNDIHMGYLNLTCNRGNKQFGLFQPSWYDQNTEQREAISKLEEEYEYPDKVFFITFYGKQNKNIEIKSDEDIDYIINDVAILHIDSPSRFHFSFPNDPIVINIELTDPKMKPIVYNRLPKNSRIVYEDNEGDGALELKAEAAVRLWENNATDQKMTCDINWRVTFTR